MVATDPVDSTASTQAAQPPRTDWRQGPLPEIIGYVGAALVVSAGLNLVSQAWETWPLPVQFGFITAGVIALYATAGAITMATGGRGQLPDHVARRRLTGVLLSVAAPLLAAWLAIALDWGGVTIDDEGAYWPLAIIAAAVVGGCLAAWWAPGVVPTIAVALACFIWLQVFIGLVLGPWEQPVAVGAVSAVATVGWLVIAPRLLPPRILTQAFGIAAFIILQLSDAFIALDMPDVDVAGERALTWALWFARMALIVFAVVNLVIFARGGSWVWAVGGVVAAGIAALSIAGQTLGYIAGLFVAGVLLLAVSGVLVVARGRHRAEVPTSDPEQ